MAKIRATFGKGFYWAFSKCVDLEEWKSEKVSGFSDILTNKYRNAKHFLKPTAHENLNEEVGEFIENMRKFRKEIGDMDERLQNALLSNKELLKKQGKDLAKDAAKSVAKKGASAAATGGASLVKDALSIVEELLPKMGKIAGNALAEKSERIEFYAKRGLADHALILFTGYSIIHIAETKFKDNNDDKYVKNYGSVPFAIDTKIFGKQIRFGQVTTIGHEIVKLDLALRTYGGSIDRFLEQSQSLHQGLLAGSGADSDGADEVHGKARVSVDYGRARFKNVDDKEKEDDGDFLDYAEDASIEE